MDNLWVEKKSKHHPGLDPAGLSFPFFSVLAMCWTVANKLFSQQRLTHRQRTRQHSSRSTEEHTALTLTQGSIGFSILPCVFPFLLLRLLEKSQSLIVNYSCALSSLLPSAIIQYQWSVCPSTEHPRSFPRTRTSTEKSFSFSHPPCCPYPTHTVCRLECNHVCAADIPGTVYIYGCMTHISEN